MLAAHGSRDGRRRSRTSRRLRRRHDPHGWEPRVRHRRGRGAVRVQGDAVQRHAVSRRQRTRAIVDRLRRVPLPGDRRRGRGGSGWVRQRHARVRRDRLRAATAPAGREVRVEPRAIIRASQEAPVEVDDIPLFIRRWDPAEIRRGGERFREVWGVDVEERACSTSSCGATTASSVPCPGGGRSPGQWLSIAACAARVGAWCEQASSSPPEPASCSAPRRTYRKMTRSERFPRRGRS